jgi:DNA repair protein RecN (Recombination protein N)
MIRAGCDRAEVSATFDLTHCAEARDWLTAQALDDGDECVIRRVLVREGRARAFINGRSASSAQLRALGDLLVDIHGQHAHQSLLRAAAQRNLLDAYGAEQALAAEVADLFRTYRELDPDTRLAGADRCPRCRAERLDLLRFQVQELSDLGLADGELDALDAEQRRLANLGQLQGTAAALVELLYDGEGACATSSATPPASSRRSPTSNRSSPRRANCSTARRCSWRRPRATSAATSTNSTWTRHAWRRSSIDWGIHDMARKYRTSPEQLGEALEERERELSALEQADQTLGTLEEDLERARTTLLQAARRLSEARRAAADRLSETVTASMQELGMGGGRFSVAVETGADDGVGAHGLDTVTFLVSANPGQPLQPLAKVASGGELSRISLAIQVATATLGSIPTLVFDEVDVGIGGGVAEIVGRLLRRLGDARQALCVTHLPQVAAQAHQQLKVQKQAIDGGETYTEIRPLADAERVDEIARMLGGTEITDTTRAHAAEMLTVAS